jgi:hypothetical protein
MVECQIVTLVVTGSSPVIYPIKNFKKINIFNNKISYGIYSSEMNNKLTNFINADIYKNVDELLNYAMNSKFFIPYKRMNLKKNFITVSIFQKSKILKRIKEVNKKTLNIINRDKHFKFYNFYENYLSFFVLNEHNNLISFKKYKLIKKKFINTLKKKHIHLNINLVGSQIFLSISKNFKNYVS